MLDRDNLFTLGRTLSKADPSSQVAYSFGEEKYSYSQLNEALRVEMNELVGTYAL
jgi:hypothetical protein